MQLYDQRVDDSQSEDQLIGNDVFFIAFDSAFKKQLRCNTVQHKSQRWRLEHKILTWSYLAGGYNIQIDRSLPCPQAHEEWLVTGELKTAHWYKNIHSVDLDEGNMIFTAISTTQACVTLPLKGFTYKVAFLTADHFGS